MLLSICIPVHNRTYDLRSTLPFLIEAANYSPPVEIIILDYNSPDDLQSYIAEVRDSNTLSAENKLVCPKYFKKNYYHMAHARNLSVLASTGDYVSISSADIYPHIKYIEVIRSLIDKGSIWICGRHQGLITIKRSEFINAGGYDERFEFYGPEDKDINARFSRRGLHSTHLPDGFLFYIKTPNSDKVKNYRLRLSKKEMGDMMWSIYLENMRNSVLEANPFGWGSWE